MKPTLNKKSDSPMINEQIRTPKVQLILDDGTNLGIVSIDEARSRSLEAGLDLVQISPKGKEGVPVVKIMDFGKAQYEKKKKLGESKKHQKIIQVKEVKIRPKIGEHDYQTKMKQVIQFIKEGKRVKISLFFRGREAATKNVRGAEIFDKINQTFQQYGLLQDLIQEEDTNSNKVWSQIYYLKPIKK